MGTFVYGVNDRLGLVRRRQVLIVQYNNVVKRCVKLIAFALRSPPKFMPKNSASVTLALRESRSARRDGTKFYKKATKKRSRMTEPKVFGQNVFIKF